MTTFTPELRRQVAKAIDDAPAAERIGWRDVVRMAEDLGVSVTRQWLSRCELVSAAYHRHRKAHRTWVANGGSAEVDPGTRKVKESEEKLTQAMLRIDLFERQFVRWLYNARQKGVGVEDLERPVPKLETPELECPRGGVGRHDRRRSAGPGHTVKVEHRGNPLASGTVVT